MNVCIQTCGCIYGAYWLWNILCVLVFIVACILKKIECVMVSSYTLFVYTVSESSCMKLKVVWILFLKF